MAGHAVENAIDEADLSALGEEGVSDLEILLDDDPGFQIGVHQLGTGRPEDCTQCGVDAAKGPALAKEGGCEPIDCELIADGLGDQFAKQILVAVCQSLATRCGTEIVLGKTLGDVFKPLAGDLHLVEGLDRVQPGDAPGQDDKVAVIAPGGPCARFVRSGISHFPVTLQQILWLASA